MTYCYKMFSKLKILFPVIILLHANVRVKSDDFTEFVSYVVSDCQNYERNLAAIEGIYLRKTPQDPREPERISGPSFVKEDTQFYEFERDQRKFECVADKLEVYDDHEELYSSHRYRSLVHQCKAKQPIVPKCNPYDRYRSINGTCNNLFNPTWGSLYDCFQRLFPANYEGVSGLRKSVRNKEPLPNARDISRVLAKPVTKRTKKYNALFAFFGQTIVHDAAHFPFTHVNGTGIIQCCDNSDDLHPQCIPIYICPDDPFYSKIGVECFTMVRVSPCITCSLEKRVPITAVTAFLDCSFVYGSTDDRAQELRRNDGSGKLKPSRQYSYEVLPPEFCKGICGYTDKEEYCFKAGDSRVNQQTPLMTFHTLFFNEHNRIADILKDMHPHWDEEMLYQESRKILIAEWQVIIYNEYLPLLIGPKLMKRRRLYINSPGEYDPTINPMISVEFNGAPFRVHSILPGVAAHNGNDEYLRFLYRNASIIYDNEMSEFLFNMANTEAEKYDRFFPRDVTNYLYKSLVGTWGFDLVAIDIQRGRDVGLPTYAQVIEHLWHPEKPINSFDDLKPFIDPECLENFQKLYADVRDVDFFVGIICEKIPHDMIISPTAARFIAHQFNRLKFGDRHFWEFENGWTDEQREIVKRASLAKVICDNTEVNFIQPKVFELPSESNIPQACSTIPGMDLSLW